MKRIVSILLLAVMLLGLAAPVMADSEPEPDDYSAIPSSGDDELVETVEPEDTGQAADDADSAEASEDMADDAEIEIGSGPELAGYRVIPSLGDDELFENAQAEDTGPVIHTGTPDPEGESVREPDVDVGGLDFSSQRLLVGGVNINAVIAGHRGWRGAPYFLNLNKLEPGDEITVTNLWDTLTYRVCEVRVIEPDDIEEVLIQPGRDMLTLLTCHPYASGGRYRLVVYAERTTQKIG